MCSLCGEYKNGVYAEVFYIEICERCFNLCNMSKDDQISSFVNRVAHLQYMAEEYGAKMDEKTRDYLNFYHGVKAFKIMMKELQEYKKEIHKEKRELESIVELVSAKVLMLIVSDITRDVSDGYTLGECKQQFKVNNKMLGLVSKDKERINGKKRISPDELRLMLEATQIRNIGSRWIRDFQIKRYYAIMSQLHIEHNL
jgi:hypothetical protein